MTSQFDLFDPVQRETAAILPGLEVQEEESTDLIMPQVVNMPFTADDCYDIVNNWSFY